MTRKEACKEWRTKNFTGAPEEVQKQVFQETIEDLESLCLQGKKLYAPSEWGCMYVPEDQADLAWILDHIEEVESIGFIVLVSDQFGILLGLEGKGESYFEKQWGQLYKARVKKVRGKKNKSPRS